MAQIIDFKPSQTTKSATEWFSCACAACTRTRRRSQHIFNALRSLTMTGEADAAKRQALIDELQGVRHG